MPFPKDDDSSFWKGATEQSRSMRTLYAAVGVSVLAKTAAIGALLILKPVPHLAPPLDAIEILIVPEQPAGGPYTDSTFAANRADGWVDISPAPFLSLMQPNVTATPSSPDWSTVGRSFD